MKKSILVLAILAALLTALPAAALNKAAKELIYEKYEGELKVAASARDSIRILYNMFDLSARHNQLIHGWQILDVSDRAQDLNAKVDMIRTLGTFYPSNDSIIDLLLHKSDEIPNKALRASTRTYILNQYFMRKNRRISDPKLQIMLLDSIMKSHDLKGGDIYDELSVIYQILTFLGVDAEGVLFRESLETYEELVDQLPMSDYPLKSQLNTTLAMIHSRLNGDEVKAVQADRDMLALIAMLEQMYRKQNRRYRGYDVNKFISYRRMLSNYGGLEPDELEWIHDSILAIIDRDFDVQTTVKRDGHPSGFYHMAKKDYARALPLLQGMFEGPYLTAYQRQKYYWMVMTSAKETGDHDAYVAAMEGFIQNTMMIDSIKALSIAKEIMVRDSILPTPLLSHLANHGNKKARRVHRSNPTLMVLSGVLALLLIVYVMLYLRLLLRQSRR